MSDPAVSGVVGGLPIFAGLTRLVIPPDEEDPVVRSCRERKGHQDTDSKRRNANNLVIAEKLKATAIITTAIKTMTVVIERYTRSNIMKITMTVVTMILTAVFSALTFASATSVAPPVT